MENSEKKLLPLGLAALIGTPIALFACIMGAVVLIGCTSVGLFLVFGRNAPVIAPIPDDLPAGLIVFEGEVGDSKELYLFDPQTQATTRITQNDNYDGSADWSPDGDQLVFTSFVGDRLGIYIMDADGSNRMILVDATTLEMVGWPRWSPQGDLIAFEAVGDNNLLQIFVMNLDGSEIRQVTSGGHNSYPAWSPDGQQIAFSRSPAEGEDSEIFTIDLDGENLTQLVSNDAPDYLPTWSPDGDQIAYSSEVSDLAQLFIVSAAGGSPEQITVFSLHDTEVLSSSWSPDGSYILAHVRSLTIESGMYLISPEDGQMILLLSSSTRSMDPRWQP